MEIQWKSGKPPTEPGYYYLKIGNGINTVPLEYILSIYYDKDIEWYGPLVLDFYRTDENIKISEDKWTKKKPTKPGYYWFRNITKDVFNVDPTIIRLSLRYVDDLEMEFPGSDVPVCLDHYFENGEWAGPIPEPK